MSQQTEDAKNIKQSITELFQKSDEIFNPLFELQDRQEKTRRLLEALKKFKYIFQLPTDIKQNIADGEYEYVVQNYKRGVSLISKSEHKAFVQVFNEIESIIANFKKKLQQDLEKDQTLDVYIKTIRTLTDLETDKEAEDPAMYFFKSQHQRLTKSFEKHEILITEKVNNLKEKEEALQKMGEKISQILPNLYYFGINYFAGNYEFKPPGAKTGKAVEDLASGVEEIHHRFRRNTKVRSTNLKVFTSEDLKEYIDIIVDSQTTVQTVLETVFEKWELPSDSFSQYALYKRVQKNKKDVSKGAKLKELSLTTKPYHLIFGKTKKLTEKVGRAKEIIFVVRLRQEKKRLVIETDSTSSSSAKKALADDSDYSSDEDDKEDFLSIFYDLIADSLDKYSIVVKSFISDNSNFQDIVKQDVIIFLSKTVEHVYKCFTHIEPFEIPEDITSQLTSLLTFSISLFLETLNEETVNDIKILYSVENWQFDNRPNRITQLVVLFEELVSGRIGLLTYSSYIFKNETALEKITQSFFGWFYLLADNFNYLLVDKIISDKKNYFENLSALQIPMKEIEESDETDKKFLMLLNNIRHTRKKLVAVLCKTFLQLFPDTGKIFFETSQKVQDTFLQLEGLVEKKYLKQKLPNFQNLITKNLTQNVHDNKNPEEIRDYILELLLSFVFLHSEIYQNCKAITQSMISRFYEFVLQIVYDTIYDCDHLSENLLLQIILEIKFLDVILENYQSEYSKKLHQTILAFGNQFCSLEKILKKIQPDLDGIINRNVLKTSVMLGCFVK